MHRKHKLVEVSYFTCNNLCSDLSGRHVDLRLERGGGQRIFLSCACFLITQSFLKIYRHAIHQIKAEYHSYLLASLILYNSSEVKLKIAKELENQNFETHFPREGSQDCPVKF